VAYIGLPPYVVIKNGDFQNPMGSCPDLARIVAQHLGFKPKFDKKQAWLRKNDQNKWEGTVSS